MRRVLLTCAALLLLSTSAASATMRQVTILGPADGTLSSSPQEDPPHHAPFDGDWAADVAGAAGRPVYARFSNESGALALSVISDFEPCASPNEGTAGVGVRVQVTVDGESLGVVNYLHLADPHPPGPIANGDQIGTMVAGTPTSCWSGPHTHIEPRNDHKYSCFQATPLSSPIGATTKLGVLGGEYVGAQNQLCPAGAVDYTPPPTTSPPPATTTTTTTPPPPPPPLPPAPPPAPTASVRRVPQSLAGIRRSGLIVHVRCSQDCRIAGFLAIADATARRLKIKHAKGRVIVASGFAYGTAAVDTTVTLRLTPAARRRLTRTTHATLGITVANSSGAKTPVTRRYLLRKSLRRSRR